MERAVETEPISWDGGSSTQRFRLQMQALYGAFTHITYWPQRFSFSFPSCLGTGSLNRLRGKDKVPFSTFVFMYHYSFPHMKPEKFTHISNYLMRINPFPNHMVHLGKCHL